MIDTPEPPDPTAEYRRQRHEFILHYYDMATKDLDRHLKVGWETIAIVAGAIATLSIAPERLPVPLAVTTSLVILFWGMLHLLDANYWAVRAIAFLANVEAIYFSKEDRRHIHPYVGWHPSFKLLNSLKHQLGDVLYSL
jgi:hypothetical protein